MSNSESPEVRELNLVGKVEMRIAMCSSDEKLQSVLTTYLPPLLLKLVSEYVKVRNKVIEVCQHINTRIKPPSIKLPVTALLKQFKENPNALVRHFDLLYIQQGVDRLSHNERLDLLPQMLHGLESVHKASAAHAATLFNMFLRLLPSMDFPARGNRDDLSLRQRLGLDERLTDVTFVVVWLGKLLLFSIGQPGATRCPGLSKDDFYFLQMYGKKDVWKPASTGGLNLVETKVLACKFLASGAFLDSERFLPALFASADPNSRISDFGDDMMKRATSAVSFEDPVLVAKLYEIYLGSRGAEGSLPVRAPLQAKILSILCRSKQILTHMAESTQIVQEALAPSAHTEQSEAAPTQKRGLEASKLKAQVFAFTNWLSRIGTPTDLATFAPALVGELRDYIEGQGWPRYQVDPEASAPTAAAALSSRGYGYESIGLLAAACPEKLLEEPNLDLIRWLLTSLSEDSAGKETSASIEAALSSILGAVGSHLDIDFQDALTSLLLHHVNQRSTNAESRIVRDTRYIAVRFANRCLPFSNATARWINVRAMHGESNDRSAILEEGRRGLDPYWYKMLNPIRNSIPVSGNDHEIDKYHFPSLADIVNRFFGPESFLRLLGQADMQNEEAYNAALTFCRCILLHQGLTAIKKIPVVDIDWERNIDALVANDEATRQRLKVYFGDLSDEDSKALDIYLQIAFAGLVADKGADRSKAGEYILELCSLSPSSSYTSLAAKISSLLASIYSTDFILRDRSSHIFGLLASLPECSKSAAPQMIGAFEQKSQTWGEAIGVQILHIHGAILATAYFLSRSSARNNRPPNFDNLQASLATNVLNILGKSRDKTLLDAAVTALSELALFSVVKPATMPESHTAFNVVELLAERARKEDEEAVTALGAFATQCDEDSSNGAILDEIILRLYDLHTVRQAEVQFAIGAALCCAAAGWQSKSLVTALDLDVPLPTSPVRNKTLPAVLDHVLSDCKSTKPAMRQASVIWLLCLVQYCGHLDDVHSRLRECQVAFKGFLADRDSLNQESASRGLTLVYEKGNRALRDDLIRDLVGSFTETKANFAGTVSEDTELFDAGALPTGDGSITTYRDIMSLASEVGDSTLVYKFMSLASNNAIWSSRAAFGRFGLSNILSDASTEGYLAETPRLYPALFRYRFDPNANVRAAMNDIWTALVKDPSKIIDQHFDGIMNDLLKNILGKEWRVRQASCAAIADLIQGRQLERYEKFLTYIWEVTFKVCDDIKESVREAAMALARVLTGILTRSLEAGESSVRSSDKMLKQVLPFLLSPAGLESGAPDVQEFARKTLLKIITSSNGKTLRPFTPDLVGRLLVLLSSIEPEMINYLHLKADKYGLTAQELDDARLKHIRGSKMLEAIERCLDFLDETSMPELQLSLENAIKTVVGLPSKVGCSRVLVSLSTRQNFIFKPYADHFIPLARKQVFDRNDTISSSYAAACGYLARLASDDVLLKLVESCRKLYFESDEERHRMIAGDILYAISKYASDRFKALAAEILPVVFVAKHDTYERARSLFDDVWKENVAGNRTVLLYLKEIISLASQHLESTRWSIKHTSAFAVADVVTSSGTSINDANAKTIWPALEKALAGKTWAGKETVLKALIQYAKYSTLWLSDQSMSEQLEKIVLRESKRNNAVFRPHALEALSDFVTLRKETDMYPQTYATVQPLIESSLDDSEDMDVDSKSGGPSSKSITESTLANAAMALLNSLNPSIIDTKDLSTRLSQTLHLSNRIIKEHRGRKAIDAIYDCERSLFEKIAQWPPKSQLAPPQSLSNPLLEKVLSEYANQIFASSDHVEQTRVKAAEAAVAMAPIARQGGNELKVAFARGLTDAKGLERSVPVRQILERAGRLLEE